MKNTKNLFARLLMVGSCYVVKLLTDKVFVYFGGDVNKIGFFGDVSYVLLFWILLFVFAVVCCPIVVSICSVLFGGGDNSKAEGTVGNSSADGLETEGDEKNQEKVATAQSDFDEQKNEEKVVTAQSNFDEQKNEEKDVNEKDTVQQKKASKSDSGCGCLLFILVVLFVLTWIKIR